MKRSGCVFAIAVALSTFSCNQQVLEHPPRSLFTDTQVVAVDGTAPYTRFDGGAGSILLTEGWGAREGKGGGGDWGNYSWVVDDEATIYFSTPRLQDIDFFARCLPFPTAAFLKKLRPGHTIPPQTVSLILDGQPAGTQELKAGWQEIRMALPDQLLKKGLQKLVLKFDHTTKPSLISESADNRNLAAAFSEIAIVPAELQEPRILIDKRASMLKNGQALLPPGGSLEVPLPAGAEADLRIGAVSRLCPSCVLSFDLLSPEGPTQEIWRGKPSEAAGLKLSLSTPSSVISRLRLLLAPAENASFFGQDPVSLEIPDDFVRISNTPSNLSQKPNVFIYTVDTLRSDVLAPYGGDPSISPEISEFAEEAVTYLAARAPSSWTLPSVVSLLTGTYADRHHIMKGNIKFSEEVARSLPGLLSEAGYDTLAISQSFVISAKFGLAESFETFFLNDHLNSHALGSQRIRKFLLQWLYSRGRDERPLFAYIHTVGPHAPYSPQGRFRGPAKKQQGRLSPEKYRPLPFMIEGYGSDPVEVAHLRALYNGEVMYADDEFGKFIDLLKHLNLYNESLIILVSDHGEEFGEHGAFDHGRTLYDELLRVPLIVKYPNSKWAGMQIHEPVSTLDVAPTVLSQLGFDEGALRFDGEPLAPTIEKTSEAGRSVFAEVNPAPSEHRAAVDLRALVYGNLKCIQSLTKRDQFNQEIPEWRTFDLGDDAGEKSPLDSADARAKHCRDTLQSWFTRRREGAQKPTNLSSEESLAKLRSLGYIK